MSAVGEGQLQCHLYGGGGQLQYQIYGGGGGGGK